MEDNDTMTLLAVYSILIAQGAVRDASKRVATVLRGTPKDTPLGFSEIAASVGIDLRRLPATSRFLTFLSIEAALEHEGWKTAPDVGTLKRWAKPTRRRS